MTVYKRKDRGGAWYYDFWRHKQRHHRQAFNPDGAPCRNKTEADSAERRAMAAAEARGAEVAKIAGLAPDTYILGQAVLAWLKRKEKRGASHRNNARLYAAEISGFFGASTPIGQIPEAKVSEYVEQFAPAQTIKKWKAGRVRRDQVKDVSDPAHWSDTGKVRSARTTNNYLKALRSILAGAAKVRDPVTKRPVIDQVPEIKLLKVPRRLPRPIPDAELHARLAVAPPWTVEAGELARLFRLRLTEALTLQIRHIDRQEQGIRFGAGDTKSGNEEMAHGGDAGWRLLLRLERQAKVRGTTYLVTWPGVAHWQAWQMHDTEPPKEAWRPLKSVRSSWRSSATAAEIAAPHRFHDIRARGITEVAKVMPAAAQAAARHQDPATTSFYIGFASREISDAVAKANAVRPSGPKGTSRRKLVGTSVGTRASKSTQKGLRARPKN